MSDKYHRLVIFIVDICPKPLRQLFISKAKADQLAAFTTLENYLLSRRSDIDNLHRRHKITDDQYLAIYPHNGSVDIKEWDVTLLTVLLKELFRRQLQQTEVDNIYNIKDIRNNLQHIAESELVDENTFNNYWTHLKDAIIALSTGLPIQTTIQEEMNAALTENMPNLGQALRRWNNVMFVQLEKQNDKIEHKLDLHTNDIQSVKDVLNISNQILTKVSVKKKGSSGRPYKRMKIHDSIVERMGETLRRGLDETNDINETHQQDIEDIVEKLRDNHRVIVTGFDNKKIYKCALAAIQEMEYKRTDQCLEISNPSDWKRVGSEEAEIVLFREPFGRSVYDVQKVEVMMEEFDNMLHITNERNESVIDIIIVSNQKRLNEVTRQHEHEMLSPTSTVYIDSIADTEADDMCSKEDTVLENLMDRSKIYKQTNTSKKVDTKTKSETENIFVQHNTVAIVGPAGSGKTGLSFDLLSSYDLSNGEENFLVVLEPEELKYVKFSLRPVLILKLLPGIEFDLGEARRWFRQFDILQAAVRKNKIAVISIIDSDVFRMWQSNMPKHHLLEHVVYIDGGSTKKRAQSGQATTELTTSGTQTDRTSDSDDNDKNVTDQRVRSVKSVRSYNINYEDDENDCYIIGSCILPTGEVLLTDYNNKKLKKLNVDYEHVSECSLPGDPDHVCYIGNNEAVVPLWSNKLQFVNVAGSMTLTRVIDTDHPCSSLACHGNLLYVADNDSVHVYTTDGTYQKCLYTLPDTCRSYYSSSITVSNDGSRIYIIDDNHNLITINNSGQHEFTLPDETGQPYISDVCVDDQGYVYVIGYEADDDDVTFVIVQISSDGRQKLGTVFELDDVIYQICFDREKSALLVAGRSNKIKLLKLQ